MTHQSPLPEPSGINRNPPVPSCPELPVLAVEEIRSGRGRFFLSPAAFQYGEIPSEFQSACRLYLDEVRELARLGHPTRYRPLLAGHGYYPAMGADPVPAIVTSGLGSLCASFTNQQELRPLMVLAECYGYSTQELFGDFRGLLPIRGAAAAQPSSPGSRFGCLFGGAAHLLGLGVDASPPNPGILSWRNLSVLPAAGDEFPALSTYLTGEGAPGFDVLWLKGALRYQFGGDAARFSAWFAALDAAYLLPGAVVLAARDDRIDESVLTKHGYVRYRVPNAFTYPDVSPLGVASDFTDLQPPGYSLGRGDPWVSFRPLGDFGVYVKVSGG